MKKKYKNPYESLEEMLKIIGPFLPKIEPLPVPKPTEWKTEDEFVYPYRPLKMFEI